SLLVPSDDRNDVIRVVTVTGIVNALLVSLEARSHGHGRRDRTMLINRLLDRLHAGPVLSPVPDIRIRFDLVLGFHGRLTIDVLRDVGKILIQRRSRLFVVAVREISAAAAIAIVVARDQLLFTEHSRHAIADLDNRLQRSDGAKGPAASAIFLVLYRRQ